MVRRVGFEQEDKEAKKSIAGSHLDDFRKRHNHELSPNPLAPSVKKRRNWFVILFLFVWLLGWSFGMLMAIGTLLSGPAEPFLVIWIVAASGGWLFVMFALRRQIKGTPLTRNKQ
jgi:hypothetical protein